MRLSHRNMSTFPRHLKRIGAVRSAGRQSSDSRHTCSYIDEYVTRVNASERGFNAAGIVDGASGQGARYRHGSDERRNQIARAQGEHLLRGVYSLAAGYTEQYAVFFN